MARNHGTTVFLYKYLRGASEVLESLAAGNLSIGDDFSRIASEANKERNDQLALVNRSLVQVSDGIASVASAAKRRKHRAPETRPLVSATANPPA